MACVALYRCPEVFRNANRFARKYWLAQLLAARLYQDERDLKELKKEITETELYKGGDEELHKVMKFSTPQLQLWVSRSFNCDGYQTPAVKHFVASVVKPATNISVSSVSERMVHVMGRYISILKGDCASEEDSVNLKIACASMSGQLSQHPLVQGLLCGVWTCGGSVVEWSIRSCNVYQCIWLVVHLWTNTDLHRSHIFYWCAFRTRYRGQVVCDIL